MDGVWELDSDTPITRILGGYGERAIISHGVEDGNDFTDRVVSRRNCYLLIIGIRVHISRIHGVEHALIGSKQHSHRSDGWVPILVLVDPF